MNEFEFDKESIDRILKVVQMYPMSLSDCADILEMVAPLCAMFTPEGFRKIIDDMEFISGLGEDK